MTGNLHWRVLDAGHFNGRSTINVTNSITSTYFQVHWSRDDTQRLIDKIPEYQDKLLQEVVSHCTGLQGFEMKVD